MRVRIFQIDPHRDKDNQLFLRLKDGESVDPTIYDVVFDAEIEEEDPEAIFERMTHGSSHPLYCKHRDISVSDIIVVGDAAYYYQPTGFVKIDFDCSQTHELPNTLRIVYVEPQKAPYISFVQHELSAMQRAVDGFIEIVGNADGTVIVCDEEAKLTGKEGNRHIPNSGSIIAGAFFVIGFLRSEFCSLTDEQIALYMRLFANPEVISKEEVDTNIFFEFFSL